MCESSHKVLRVVQVLLLLPEYGLLACSAPGLFFAGLGCLALGLAAKNEAMLFCFMLLFCAAALSLFIVNQFKEQLVNVF